MDEWNGRENECQWWKTSKWEGVSESECKWKKKKIKNKQKTRTSNLWYYVLKPWSE